MSYGAAAALQAAVYQRLAAVPALAGVPVLRRGAAGRGHGHLRADRAGGGAGCSRTRPGAGPSIGFGVSVISDAAGFLAAKAMAVAVSDALVDAPLVLTRGRLVGLWFLRARGAAAGRGRDAGAST